MLGTWTTLATVTTLTSLRTRTTLTLWTLLVVSRLLNENTARELVLASLLVDVDELHVNLVILLDASLLDSIETLPVNLRDVEQTVLARQELNEASVWHD